MKESVGDSARGAVGDGRAVLHAVDTVISAVVITLRSRGTARQAMGE